MFRNVLSEKPPENPSAIYNIHTKIPKAWLCFPFLCINLRLNIGFISLIGLEFNSYLSYKTKGIVRIVFSIFLIMKSNDFTIIIFSLYYSLFIKLLMQLKLIDLGGDSLTRSHLCLMIFKSTLKAIATDPIRCLSRGSGFVF